MDRPDVSFVMAARNASGDIEAALRSALAQQEVGVEVVVFDDASTDDTAARVQAIAAGDARVTLLRGETSRGAAAARNAAIGHARGAWIAILDADDWVEAGRCVRLITQAVASGSPLVADNLRCFLDEDSSVSWPLLPDDGGAATRIGFAEFLGRNLMTGGDGNLGYLKPLVSREFIARNGVAYDERLRIGEDFGFFLRCLAAGAELVVVPRPGYHYRIRNNSLSRGLTQQDLSTLASAYSDILDGVPLDHRARRADHAFRRSLADMSAYVDFRSRLRQRDWTGVFRRALNPRLWRAAPSIVRGALHRRWMKRKLHTDQPRAKAHRSA